MRVTKTVTITTAGVLDVTVSVPDRSYVGVAIEAGISCSPLIGERYGVDIDWGDGVVEHFDVYDTDFPLRKPHTYGAAGTYTITVYIKDYDTLSEGTGTASIEIRVELTVDFTAEPTTGVVPLDVTFTIDVSGGFEPYSWTLDPGDGSAPYSGTLATAGTTTQVHTYTKVGTFTATLTVTDALGATMVGRVALIPMRVLLPWIAVLTGIGALALVKVR